MVTAVPAPPAQRPPTPWLAGRPTLSRALRWGVIAAVTLVAFRGSIEVTVASTRGAAVNGYLWILPPAAILAAAGICRHGRPQPPIHDRQTDLIVGTMGLVLAALVHGVLSPRYSEFFALLRLDLTALVLFVASAAVVLFGLRSVARFGWVWALLLLGMPLPYHLTVIVFGGGKVGAGVTGLVIAAAATAIALGRNRFGALRGALLAWSLGLAYLGVLTVWLPDASLLVYQLNPSLTSIMAVGLVLAIAARRRPPTAPPDPGIEPLTGRDIGSGALLIIAVGLVLAVLPLPPGARAPTPPRIDGLTLEAPLAAPDGWHVTDVQDYRFVKRLYGRDATLVRQKMVADTGNPEWDRFSRPRTVVVDSVTTRWPKSLQVYPAQLLYNVSERLSDRRHVDLGYGVTGQLLTAVDDDLLLTWNVLDFQWRSGGTAQRVLIGSVDNHEPDALFPPPNGGVGKTLAKLLTVLFRGNAVVVDQDAVYEDADLLTAFGRGLVAAQMRSLRDAAVGAPR